MELRLAASSEIADLVPDVVRWAPDPPSDLFFDPLFLCFSSPPAPNSRDPRQGKVL